MWIAISQRHEKGNYEDYVDVLENNYVEYLEGLGFNLMLIPNTSGDIKKYLNLPEIEGIIISGGNTVNPSLYSEEIKYPLDDISDKRDGTEKRLLEIAIERGLPVLGICRGMQFINVFFGGRLVQDIEKDTEYEHKPREDHSIDILHEGVSELTGRSEARVNSYHNQAVLEDNLAAGLRIFALARDTKIVEGLYHEEHPIAGMQWHPERKSPEPDFNKLLIKAFMDRKLFWKGSR